MEQQTMSGQRRFHLPNKWVPAFVLLSATAGASALGAPARDSSLPRAVATQVSSVEGSSARSVRSGAADPEQFVRQASGQDPRVSAAAVRSTRVASRVTQVTPTIAHARGIVRGKITEFAVPGVNPAPAGVVSFRGNVWFINYIGNQVVEFDVRSGAFQQYRIPTRNSGPVRIAPDHAGNLWFTESNAGQIGEFTVSTGTFHEYAIPTPGSSPFDVAVGADGIWFTEQGACRLGRLANGMMTEYLIPTPNCEPIGLRVDASGSIWFTELGGRKIGRLDPTRLTFIEYAVANGRRPFQITAGPNGTFWFSALRHDAIGTITSRGRIRLFRIPQQSRPYDIVFAAGGAFWFEEGTANKIGRITPDGNATNEYTIPTPNSGAHAIAAGPGNRVWFTEIFANKLAFISTE